MQTKLGLPTDEAVTWSRGGLCAPASRSQQSRLGFWNGIFPFQIMVCETLRLVLVLETSPFIWFGANSWKQGSTSPDHRLIQRQDVDLYVKPDWGFLWSRSLPQCEKQDEDVPSLCLSLLLCLSSFPPYSQPLRVLLFFDTHATLMLENLSLQLRINS